MLLEIASYYWALREAPYGFRYERIELELSDDSSSPGHEAVVFTSHPQQGARRWVTRIPIPVPAHIASDVTGLGFTIRGWIAGGGGRLGDDGSFVRQL